MKPIDDTKKHLVSFFENFRDFILKRSAIDMALGIIIGMAFSKVVSSLVNDIIMPPIGLILGGVNFSDLKIVLKHVVINQYGKITDPEVAIHYGKFTQSLIDFAIVGLCSFLIIKIINSLIHKKPDNLDWTEYIKQK